MKNMLFALATVIGSVAAAGGELGDNHDHPWDYSNQNGRDWPMKTKKALKLSAKEENECAGSNQSPIDLRSDFPKVKARDDSFQKMYNNQVSANTKSPSIGVDWNGHTSQTGIINKGQDLQMFESQHGKDFYKTNERYSGKQFHFHHGSEHTIDGMRQDLEMHTVHLAEGAVQNGFFAAAMGIFFSVDEPRGMFSEADVAVIDKFFDDLSWEKTTAKKPLVKVNSVSYGELMMMVDMNNRWTYKGSVTTPPCKQNVYWNVLKTVYPIKQAHLDLFKKQMEISNMQDTGNWREIQALTDLHNPTIVSTGGPASPIFMILTIVLLIVLCVTCGRVYQLTKQWADFGTNKVNTTDISQFPVKSVELEMGGTKE